MNEKLLNWLYSDNEDLIDFDYHDIKEAKNEVTDMKYNLKAICKDRQKIE